jgi:hypothetical protein
MTESGSAKDLSTVHVILTRFNVAMPYAQSPRLGIDVDWLDSRIEIFRHWALRSLQAQTCVPTLWLIFVDARTETGQLDYIRTLTEGLAELVLVDGFLDDATVAHEVATRLPADARRVITTRLDNDDLLAPYYIQRIQQAARDWVGFINPYSGLACTTEGGVFRRWDFSSPFLSFVEDRQLTSGDDIRTVFSVRHDRADTVGRVRQLGGRPMWIQLIHGANVANEAQGFPYSVRRAERILGLELYLPRDAIIRPSCYVKAGLREGYKTSVWIASRLRRAV